MRCASVNPRAAVLAAADTYWIDSAWTTRSGVDREAEAGRRNCALDYELKTKWSSLEEEFFSFFFFFFNYIFSIKI